MFRSRRLLIALLALAALPLAGCASWKCCRPAAARPAYYAAPACSACASPAGAPAVVGY